MISQLWLVLDFIFLLHRSFVIGSAKGVRPVGA